MLNRDFDSEEEWVWEKERDSRTIGSDSCECASMFSKELRLRPFYIGACLYVYWIRNNSISRKKNLLVVLYN